MKSKKPKNAKDRRWALVSKAQILGFKVKEIVFYFLRLGATGFGGPVALVAQMQKDLIEERQWISKEDFVQSLALIKSMPGALAFSTACYMGYRRAGFWGGTLAGWCLVLPAFFLILVIAQIYDALSKVPAIASSLSGMQAAALALILLSIKSLVKGYEKSAKFWMLLVAGLAFSYWGVPEPFVIVGFAAFAVLTSDEYFKSSRLKMFSGWPLLFFNPQIIDLFLICFKSGAFVFGSGLAMVPVLENDFVTKMSWLTHGQFMDALAFGQMTPGPVLITVTFVGYKISGMAGAIAATVGVFLPSQIHMTTWFPRLTGWLSKQKWISHFILGALAAVVATLASASLKLCLQSSYWQNLMTFVLAALSLKVKIPSWLLILMGGALGFVFLGLF